MKPLAARSLGGLQVAHGAPVQKISTEVECEAPPDGLDPSRPQSIACEAPRSRVATMRDQMPLLAGLARHMQARGCLSKTALFGIQHLLESTRGMMNEARCLGLDPSWSTLIGKSYSTHRPTIDGMKRDGFSRVRSAPFGDGLPGLPGWTPWHSGKEPSLADHLELESLTLASRYGSFEGSKDERERLIVLDDGAHAIERFAHLGRDGSPRLVGVEQTRFGARRVREMKDAFPVVNVAESPVKLNMESVLIGHSVAVETLAFIRSLREQGVKCGDQVCLIGYGAVGRETALALRDEGFVVTVLKTDPARQQNAVNEGFEIAYDRAQVLGRSDFVLGTTGIATLSGGDLAGLKNGAVLISASSSSVEFGTGDGADVEMTTGNAEYTWTGEEALEPSGGSTTFCGRRIALSPDSAHRHRVLRIGDRELLVANSGFPINFTGEADPIRPELIQLTRALLLLGLIQASKLDLSQRGLVPLDVDGQRWLATRWMEQVRRDGHLPLAVMARLEAAYEKTLRELG